MMLLHADDTIFTLRQYQALSTIFAYLNHHTSLEHHLVVAISNNVQGELHPLQNYLPQLSNNPTSPVFNAKSFRQNSRIKRAC